MCKEVVNKLTGEIHFISSPKLLRSLEEHNAICSNSYVASQVPQRNGIACPECGEELYDTNPNMTLTSMVPKKVIHCVCGYTGYRNC